MKKVRINERQVALVFKNGNYQRVIKSGSERIGFSEVVQIYDLAQAFNPSVELNLLLKDEELAEMLHVVEVSDTEIVLMYIDKNFVQVLTPGKYAYWKGFIDYSFTTVDLTKLDITENISLAVLQRREVSNYIRSFTVDSHEQGLLFVDGKFEKVVDTGVYYFWKNGILVTMLKADLRQRQLEISGQEILTKDKAALRVNFQAQFKVTDVKQAVLHNKEYEKQLYVLVQLAIREFVGTYTLDELLEKKESATDYVMNYLSTRTDALGVTVTDCGIRDVILPGEMKEIMNQVLVAQKRAEANTISRREETASTRSLLNTAKLMEDNSMLFKLKEMEYVEKIAEKINNISLSGGGQVVDQLREIFSGK